MFAKIHSSGVLGITAYLIDVEIDLQMNALPSWATVGLAESAVKESRERVISALKNSGYDYPFRKVIINLAPADIKKGGTAYDLPIAVGLLQASKVIPDTKLESTLLIGELSLTGQLRGVPGVLPTAILAREKKIKNLILPKCNAQEAAIVDGVKVFAFESLKEVVAFLKDELPAEPVRKNKFKEDTETLESPLDFSDIFGQHQAKRALEIAAAGGHNILLSGPPGSGKTMLASRIPTILPKLTFEESLETSKIYSVSGLLKNSGQLIHTRPFRHPHHSVSNSGLVGGGSHPKPGEVSLSHNGVLFLDELPEFQRHVLELLRQPLEDNEVTIARASMTLTFPARFILVASCNPCPCGYKGHPKILCRCRPTVVQRYQNRLSGPLLDRIDLKVDVPPIEFEDYRNRHKKSEASKMIRDRIIHVRKLQKKRFSQHAFYLNAQMTPKAIEKYCDLDETTEKILKKAMERYHLSGRGMSRILKVARTIADLDGAEKLKSPHILEAVQYRCVIEEVTA